MTVRFRSSAPPAWPETIDRFDEVRAAVHGHAHHGIYQGRTRKGIPVYNGGSRAETRREGLRTERTVRG